MAPVVSSTLNLVASYPSSRRLTALSLSASLGRVPREPRSLYPQLRGRGAGRRVGPARRRSDHNDLDVGSRSVVTLVSSCVADFAPAPPALSSARLLQRQGGLYRERDQSRGDVSHLWLHSKRGKTEQSSALTSSSLFAIFADPPGRSSP